MLCTRCAMWLMKSRMPPLLAPMTLPVSGLSLSGLEVRMRAWGAGRRRGRRENLDRVETWAFAMTEASPRMARLDEVVISGLEFG